MLYVSVLLASFTIRFCPLSYFSYTYIHTYAHLFIPFCLIRSFSSPSSLTFSFFFLLFALFPLSFTIDYTTSWQICVVLATVSYFSDTEVVSNC